MFKGEEEMALSVFTKEKAKSSHNVFICSYSNFYLSIIILQPPTSLNQPPSQVLNFT